jgi:vitamin B12 transporter
LNERWKLFVNIASAYRVPSLYELYSEYGNRNLKPETSLNYEGGVQFLGEQVNARVTFFQRDIKNVFFFYTDMNTFKSYYINEDKQKDHGLEAEVAADLGKWRLSANYTYVDGKITTAAPSGKDTSYDNLYRRPKNTFNVNVGYQATQRLYLSTHLRKVSDFLEPEYGMAPIVMKGYYVWDAFAQYQWGERLRVYAGFYNITDQKYFESRGFNSKPFNWSAGLSVSF